MNELITSEKLVCCWPEQAKALTESPFIKHITFVGSEEIGRKVLIIRIQFVFLCHTHSYKVAAAAAVNLTPVTMELGGKDPAIILPGTKIENCIGILMRGILLVIFLQNYIMSYFFAVKIAAKTV